MLIPGNWRDFKTSWYALVADMVRGGMREFVDDTDGPAFLERELVGLGVDGYQ